MTYKFFDTNSFIPLQLKDLDGFQPVISSITFQELNHFKGLQQDKIQKCEIWNYEEKMLIPVLSVTGLTKITNDLKLLACAFDYDHNAHPDETIFVTNNPQLGEIANRFFGEDSIEII